MSTRYVQLGQASLARAIRYAEAHDLVRRNVATLVDNPKGQVGRPSRSFTLEQSLQPYGEPFTKAMGCPGTVGA